MQFFSYINIKDNGNKSGCIYAIIAIENKGDGDV